MEIIGERINGMFRDIREAIANKDPKPVQEWAIKQTENGAYWLDVCTGPNAEDPMDAMKWLVSVVQDTVNTPIAIDTTNYDVMEAALKLCKRPALLNSCHADRHKIERVFPMAAETGSKIVALAMTEETGIPKTADERVMLAAELLAGCDEFGLQYDDLYLDPLLLPVNVAQHYAVEAMETLKQFKSLSDPAPKTTCGLSNTSQRCANRAIINRTMLVMLMTCGLDSAIADACDNDLMEAAATARVLLNQDIYCDSYAKIYMSPKH